MNATRSRPYRKRRRARQEEETRRRITEAVVELHRTVGPAKTTVTEVAERAGVSRMTVYNHFPNDAELIEACSTHWSARNPAPDPAGWAAADPAERLVGALRELYEWYRGTEDMMGKVLRDAPIVPPLGGIMEARWQPYIEEVVHALARGWSVDGADEDELRAALRIVTDFSTWRALVDSGMDDDRAARLAARMVSGARACDATPEAPPT